MINRHALYLPDGLYKPLQQDAAALGMSMSTLGTALFADALERARARRYAPFKLPENYRFEHNNVRPFTPKKEQEEGRA